MTLNLSKKKARKWLKVKAKLSSNGLDISDEPTNNLVLANAGLGNEVCVKVITELCEPYGCIDTIRSYMDKSYALLSYQKTDEAMACFNKLQSVEISKTSDNELATLYLYFLQTLPPSEGAIKKKNDFPQGLITLENFLSTEEEEELIMQIEKDLAKRSDMHIQETLKHRTVLHYGYKFQYGSNDVNSSNPLSKKFPSFANNILDKIMKTGHIPNRPDQLTINIYNPGDGIPHHIDNPDAFDTGIASISLGSQIVMEMKSPVGPKANIMLKPRTLLIFTGDARYKWTHGITQKKSDLVCDERSDQEFLVKRERRISMTFRKILKSTSNHVENLGCTIPDSQKSAVDLEKRFVQTVYNEIADHFSSTREKPWPKVVKFLENLNPGSVVLDVGCGSGRYLNCCPGICMLGCDSSQSLVDICLNKNCFAFLCDGQNIPVRNSTFDACICIAVIHHYSTSDRRHSAILEILRVLRKGALALIYVWAFEQRFNDIDSNYLKKSHANCNITKRNENSCNAFAENQSLVVHENKTSFVQQDLLVPWKKKKNRHDVTSSHNISADSTYYRFYHVFKQNELQNLCQGISGCNVIDCYYDSGNWAVVLQKL
ncbi:tRNA (carboxymethyluridine(34)-5-O)-methyltransferase alkbh8-like [Clavelina lepadiformis]|uniref:Fe2OG dioxygenase domain-containing protein n=1 Tax=Clavelina lepadiformis TaxID=159417 RepID=A0ABP0EZV6_CLALP